jgi:hypothetical protein
MYIVNACCENLMGLLRVSKEGMVLAAAFSGLLCTISSGLSASFFAFSHKICRLET